MTSWYYCYMIEPCELSVFTELDDTGEYLDELNWYGGCSA